MVNVTIDDSSPSVAYYPSAAWNARSASTPCSSCTANPDTSRLFDNTFHDGTFNPLAGSNDYPNIPLTASIEFNGTAVYVFCALAESSTSPDGDSDMSFYIDGSLKGTFVKTAPGNNNVYDYAIPVFSIDSLPLGMHNVTLQNGHVNGTKSLILLDEIIYTNGDDAAPSSSSQSSASATSSSSPSQTSSSQDDTSSTKGNIGSIVGPAVSVPVVVLFLAALGLCFFLKRRKRQQRQKRRTTLDSPGPLIGPVSTAWASDPVFVHPSQSASLGAANTSQYYNPYAPNQPQSSVYVSSMGGGDVDDTSYTPTSASFGLVNGEPSTHEAPPAYDERLIKAGGAGLRVKDRKTVIMNC